MKKLIFFLFLLIPVSIFSQTVLGTWHCKSLDRDFEIKKVPNGQEIRIFVPSTSGDFQIVLPITKREAFCTWLTSQYSLFQTYHGMYSKLPEYITTMSAFDGCRGCWISKDGGVGIVERIFIESCYFSKSPRNCNMIRINAFDAERNMTADVLFELTYIDAVKIRDVIMQ